MTIRCEVHTNCGDPAVARIYLSDPTKALWACLRAYEDFLEGKIGGGVSPRREKGTGLPPK